MSGAWSTQFDTTMKYLEEHGVEIGDAAEAGDALARTIIQRYQMVYDCPADPGARVFLDKAVQEWRARANTNLDNSK